MMVGEIMIPIILMIVFVLVLVRLFHCHRVKLLSSNQPAADNLPFKS